MLYKKLNAEMKRMVDDYAQRLQVYDWGRRGELLARRYRIYPLATWT